MSNRFNNRRLLYLLTGLIAILAVTVIIKIPKEQATLKSKIFSLDTSLVSRIILYPKISNGKAVEFSKIKDKWIVKQDKIISATQAGAVQNLFNEVLDLKPQSLASKDKSKWKEFDLTDSLATRIKFLDKKDKNLADLMIGKFTFKKADNPYAGYNGNNIQMTSFVRVYNEIEVYAVDGMVSFSFNIKFDDWRDKTFIKANRNDITNVRFIYPADSSFNLVKKGNSWQISDQTADSVIAANYTASLGLMNGETFRDNYKPDQPPVYQLTVEGNNLLNISVRCYKGDGIDEYLLNSSLNPDVYFTSKKNGIFDKLFKPESYFIKLGKKR
jgi:hypothetical protein